MGSDKQFIADQRLYRLHLSERERSNDAKQYLTLSGLPDGDQIPDDQSEDAAGKRGADLRRRWQPVRNRFEYLRDGGEVLAGSRRRLLCVTTNAGIGKSDCVSQLQVVQMQERRGQVVVQIEFSQLPQTMEQFFDEAWVPHGTAASQGSRPLPFIASEIYGKMKRQGDQPLLRDGDLHQFFHWVQSLAYQGRLTLVVDGLDEISRDGGASRAEALRDVLLRYRHLHCVVAGRPYAIEEYYWASLFGGVGASQWEFCCLCSLSTSQRNRFLGPERSAVLNGLQGDLEFNTRTLEVLRTLDTGTFSTLRSVSDAYWHSVSRSVCLDVKKDGKPPQSELSAAEVLLLLSATAFTMRYGWPVMDAATSALLSGATEAAVGNSREGTGSREVALTSAFRSAVVHRIARGLGGTNTPGAEQVSAAEQKFQQIQNLSTSYVEYQYFHVQGDKQLRWRDRTLQDFFSAYWLVNWGDREELDWLGERQSVNASGIGDGSFIGLAPNDRRRLLGAHGFRGGSRRHADLMELWRFVCGMPDKAMENADSGYVRWTMLTGRLYQRSDHECRATELMWRCWPNLLRRSGFLEEPAWNEADVQAASRSAQRAHDPTDAYDPTDSVAFQSGSARCQFILWEFLSEFPERLSEGSEASSVIKQDVQWCQLRGNAGTSYLTGHRDEDDNPEQSRTLDRSLEMSKYLVTRRVYRLFDDQHERTFEDYEEFSPEDRCPAIYLSWYDCRMLSYWCHADLASEWEWEYACRAGVQTSDGGNPIWWWGDDESRLQEFAWYCFGDLDTHPVGDKDPNPWGIHDQLGNVLEWTSSLWGEGGALHFFLRGGSWFDTHNCRCSDRYGAEPADLNYRIGCRLVRFP